MASSNIKENIQQSTLFKYCETGDLKRLEQYLNPLSRHEIIAINDDQNASFAHYAARYGYIHIIKYLVEKKQINIHHLRTKNGATCAHDAAVCDQVEMLNYLFHNLSPNDSKQQNSSEQLSWTIRDNQGRTPMHLAAAYDSRRTLKYLLERELANPRVRSSNGFQPIHNACSSGHVECVKLLLLYAPDTINGQTSTLLTPAFLACQSGSLETVQFLYSNNANFNLRDENGLNCLHIACQNSHGHIVQWLIETGCVHVDDVDYMNNTALHYAFANENIISYLLGKKAQISVSNNGNSPLHVAAENGKLDACAMLIEKGHCSVTLLNKLQLTPADLAERAGFSILANKLRSPSDLSSMSKGLREDGKIQLENATIIRLVVKKNNVQRRDASNQVEENELMPDDNNTQQIYHNDGTMDTRSLKNKRFNLSELRARVEEHETSRTISQKSSPYVSDILMHSAASLNQQNKARNRSKLPSQKYAPWLDNAQITPEEFHQEIQRVGTNLRKVSRDDSSKTVTEKNSNFDERQSRQTRPVGSLVMSSAKNEYSDFSVSGYESSANRNNSRTRLNSSNAHSRSTEISKSHQFISPSNSQLDTPQWRRPLNGHH